MKLKTRFFLIPVMSLLAGIGLLAVNAIHVAAYEWKPIHVPLRLEEGYSVKAGFVAELSEIHEIEVECAWTVDAAVMKRAIMTILEPSSLDISWSVHQDDQLVAQGTCREYLYTTFGGTHWKSRLKRRIFRNPFHGRGRSGSGSRGVGAFPCRSGFRYQIQADVHESLSALQAGDPHLNVRIGRRFWQQHEAKMRLIAVLGIALCSLSCPLFCAWGGLQWWSKRARQRY